MTPSRLSLPHDLLMSAFPFHVAFDSALRIVQAGQVLRRLCPDVTDGGPLQESFRIKRPNIQGTFVSIQEHADSLFILESLSNGMLLKGQMLPDAGQRVIMFLCSPWLKDLSFAEDLGLSLGDFAIHDPVADFLFLLQTKDTALADVNSLAEKLRLQRAELQRAHDELEDLVQERTAALTTANDEISERSRAEAELERALERERERARHDSLTDTLNHGAITQVLRDLCSSEKDGPLAVAMVDLDGLKAINDTYGHQIGDESLIIVANALLRNNAIVGRYGGDEFIVILPGADRAEAERYRDSVTVKLLDVSLTDPETNAKIQIVASWGLAVFPEEAENIVDLIHLSDNAMYAAKRQRPVSPNATTTGQPPPGDRAATMVGQIVPLLTSFGDLTEKLQLVARRLAVGAGYDAVNFTLFQKVTGQALSNTSYPPVPKEFVERWDRAQQPDSESHPVTLLLAQTLRPLILDDPWNDERLWESERNVLRAAQLQSVLIAPMIWQGEMIGTIGVAAKQPAAFAAADAQFLSAIATQVTAIVRMETLVDKLSSTTKQLSHSQEETVLLLAAAAEAHDHTTGLHLQSVRGLTEALAREMGLDEEEARALGLAAVLHDIGKIRVPDAILASPGKLAPDQWDVMRQHTIWGASFLAGHDGFELAAAIARSHHERWDGAGYPDGLSGNSIPQGATVVTVADAFDAMTHDRPYRASQPVDEAIKEIVRHAGKQFSPAVVEALERLYRQNELPVTHPDASVADAA